MKVPAANLHVMVLPAIRTKREPSYSSVQKYVVEKSQSERYFGCSPMCLIPILFSASPLTSTLLQPSYLFDLISGC